MWLKALKRAYKTAEASFFHVDGLIWETRFAWGPAHQWLWGCYHRVRWYVPRDWTT